MNVSKKPRDYAPWIVMGISIMFALVGFAMAIQTKDKDREPLTDLPEVFYQNGDYSLVPYKEGHMYCALNTSTHECDAFLFVTKTYDASHDLKDIWVFGRYMTLQELANSTGQSSVSTGTAAESQSNE